MLDIGKRAVFSFLRIGNDRSQPWDRSSLIKSDDGGKKERVVKTLHLGSGSVDLASGQVGQ